MLKIKKNKVKTSKSEKVVYAIAYVLLMILSLYILYYFYFALQLATKKDSAEFTMHFATNKLATWSENFTLNNFKVAIESLEVNGTGFMEMVLNSLIYSVGSMVLTLFIHSCTTYVICKYKFIGQNFLYGMVLITMMIPIYGAMPAAFRAYKAIGIYDNWGILVTALGGFSGGTFLILYSFWKGVPWEYAEASFIDGAGHFQVFLHVMFPLVLPAASVLFLTGFIGHWNEVMSIALFMPSLPTLSYGLYIYEEIMRYRANQPAFFSGIFIATIPCFILFVLFQNTIMQTVHIGGLKG